MSVSKPTIQLEDNVPVTLKRSSDGKILLIQGVAIDDTVNENSWQVPSEELPYLLLTARTHRSGSIMATELKTSKASLTSSNSHN